MIVLLHLVLLLRAWNFNIPPSSTQHHHHRIHTEKKKTHTHTKYVFCCFVAHILYFYTKKRCSKHTFRWYLCKATLNLNQLFLIFQVSKTFFFLVCLCEMWMNYINGMHEQNLHLLRRSRMLDGLENAIVSPQRHLKETSIFSTSMPRRVLEFNRWRI